MSGSLTKEEMPLSDADYLRSINHECNMVSFDRLYEIALNIESLSSRHALDQAALAAANETIAELRKGKERLERDLAVSLAQKTKAMIRMDEALMSQMEKAR